MKQLNWEKKQIILTFTIIICILLITSPFSIAKTNNQLKLVNLENAPHLLFGTAKYSTGVKASSARVEIVSSMATLTTWVNSEGEWEMNVGDPGPNWPEGHKFTVWITGCCAHGGWTGKAKGTIRGTSENMGEIILYPNIPPNTPSIPKGPIYIKIGETGVYSTNASDPDELNELQYRFDWDAEGEHNISQYTGYVQSGEYANKTHKWNTKGIYVIKAQARDEHTGLSPWSDGLTVTVYEFNNPPEKPTITGPSEGILDTIYNFNITTTDQDQNTIKYLIDWGDNTTPEWIGPYDSGEIVSITHKWTKRDNYQIKTKAKDLFEEESPWSDPINIKIVAPEIKIENIHSNPFKINAEITNIGDGTAKNLEWYISINGGIIISGKNTTGTINNINPGEQITLKSELIFGISTNSIITIKISSSNDNSHTEIRNATILFFLIILNDK